MSLLFSGAGHLFEQFTVFLCGFMLRACVFRVSSSRVQWWRRLL
jgi:hypothetical protein